MKIQKNIPLPNCRYRGKGLWIDIVNKIKPKDSVFVKTKLHRETLRTALLRKGFSVVTASEKNGYRVWRVK